MTTVDPWAIPRDLLNDLTPYGYVPTRALCIFFLAWFGVSTRERLALLSLANAVVEAYRVIKWCISGKPFTRSGGS
ncbi:hypothetical protein BDV98DRAFT_82696 [Pterulicium gracile]|uniref:Uncharacterized protein n=1 Tax=Pterulicium gracile TaxID=1884261 RepID=A0A5C3QIA2_9AGAR|nr:hypothetical protein BDV98DRAFT_82696 [Pterula gracilis]